MSIISEGTLVKTLRMEKTVVEKNYCVRNTRKQLYKIKNTFSM
jgi:hypothetical protein